MKYASEELKNEHEGILHGLAILEKMADSTESGSPVPVAEISEMVDFLKLFADKCHHGKEEGILFPILERYGVANEHGPIGQMLSEHVEGRKYIQGLSLSISNGTLDTSAFVTNARLYIELLRAHIQKENNVLFPMGDKIIPESEQQRILDAFENHEQTAMGPGIHDKLHGMLDTFQKKYL
ncbi:hemerythrin domain-containing protein [Treponema zuelzerae]|uniref:Hemerythrin domain-containing protein n=1 Tax=Teretinema zuelzerae TaxID=156 RepID=A0AAE3EHB1_9SPIR|nr:hemerythrin domain-containing protein [Teretinema zuelzerae]MCD1653838.1 hemerythrin domain-containing protein [Teretinema zuelzerae]